MRLVSILSVLFIATLGTASLAQNPTEIDHTITSEAFGNERKLRVFLPNRYYRDTTATFAVTYVLDAQHDIFWNAVKGNAGYLVDNYSIMPMIFVGIVSDDRGSEFSPPATMLQDHIENEVIPLIEKEYRTDGFRAILGHSWGGAFVGSTLFSDRNSLFNGYIGVSPSFGDTDNVIEESAEEMLKKNTVFRKYLYFSHGDVGRRELEFAGYVNNIKALIDKYPNKTLVYQPRHIERVGHWQIVGASVCDGLISMSRNYFADQAVMEGFAKKGNIKEQVVDFNRNQKEQFGYIHKASGRYFNFVANDFRDLEQYQSAIEIYQLALEDDPENVRVHVNLCDTYDKMGNTQIAKTQFLKTQQLLEVKKDEVSENFYNDVSEWIQEKLEGYE